MRPEAELGIEKIVCPGCTERKARVHFYVYRSGRLFKECKLCWRRKVKDRPISSLEGGEWQQAASGIAGPGVMQWIRGPKRRKS